MFRSLSFTITTIITITTASIVAITTRRSWWCRDIGGIITTIITITTTTITASIAATTEVDEAREWYEQDLRVLFAFACQ